MSIGIVGLGYVGLPLAVEFAEAGEQVIGLDVDTPAWRGQRPAAADEDILASGSQASLGSSHFTTPLRRAREVEAVIIACRRR